MKRYADVLHAEAWNAADFELHEVDVADPGSDELLPMKGYVNAHRLSSGRRREYLTGDGTAWVTGTGSSRAL